MKHFNYLLYIVYCAFSIAVASCDYDEKIENTQVTIELSEPMSGVNVEILNSLGQTFNVVTNSDGCAQTTLAPGIYTISASSTSDDGYVRTAVNGSKSDIVVSGTTTTIFLPVVTSTIQLNNPILIKELYVGGCQKDDGS